MKFVDHVEFDRLTEFLTDRRHGSFVIQGKLELYSCEKLPANASPSYSPITVSPPLINTGGVRQVSDGVLVLKSKPRSSSIDDSSPRKFRGRMRSQSLGSLDERCSQTLLTEMRHALNDCFPDYDFSTMKFEQFVPHSVKECMKTVNKHLEFVVKELDCQFLSKLWKSVNESVELERCEVFSYQPDMNDDPFSDGILWSFNFFIYNKERGRIAYFMSNAKRNEMEISYDSPLKTGDEDSDEDSIGPANDSDTD